MKKIYFFLFCLTLTGCAANLDDMFSISTNKDNSTGFKPISKEMNSTLHAISKSFTVTTDVDTAAARIKRYYQFSSLDEVNALRNNGTTSGQWRASAMASGAFEWSATQGSHYKMARDWGDKESNDSLLVEIGKEGIHTNVTVIYRSDKTAHVKESYTSKLFADIKKVAEGKLQ